MKQIHHLIIAAILLTGCSPAPDKSPDTSGYLKEVENAVEQLRVQLVDPDQKALENLTADILTYGHSNGHIENRAEFIESLVSEKFNFETLELTEQTVDLAGSTAIVRHRLSGNTRDAGKEPGTALLKVLQVWQKQGQNWKLLSRQAVRITPPPATTP